MDWHIPAISRVSAVGEQAFEKDDRVTSILVKGEENELLRVDVLEADEGEASLPGKLVCKWTQPFKPKSSDGKEEREAMKFTADNLFLNLFDGEEEPTLENGPLKHFLALLLERRRVLRELSRDEEFALYRHIPTKRELAVPHIELDAAFFRENEENLAFLLAKEEDEPPVAAAKQES